MRLSLLLPTLVCAAAPALAQSTGPIEIGFDAGISRVTVKPDGLASQSATIADFPLQSVRIAIPMTKYVSIEPAAGVSYFNNDGDSQTSFSGDIGALIHLMTDRTKPQVFVRPFIGYDHDSFLGGSGNHMTFGGGVGVRVPITNRFAFRAEGRYKQYAKVEDTSRNAIGLLAGLSFFTK